MTEQTAWCIAVEELYDFDGDPRILRSMTLEEIEVDLGRSLDHEDIILVDLDECASCKQREICGEYQR